MLVESKDQVPGCCKTSDISMNMIRVVISGNLGALLAEVLEISDHVGRIISVKDSCQGKPEIEFSLIKQQLVI